MRCARCLRCSHLGCMARHDCARYGCGMARAALDGAGAFRYTLPLRPDGGMADASVSKTDTFVVCEFESHSGHHQDLSLSIALHSVWLSA